MAERRFDDNTLLEWDKPSGEIIAENVPFNRDGLYTTPLLPDFILETHLIWQVPLPTAFDIVEMVKQMVTKGD